MPDPSELFSHVYVKALGVEVWILSKLWTHIIEQFDLVFIHHPWFLRLHLKDATALTLKQLIHTYDWWCYVLQAFGVDRKVLKATLP